jgi:hypothetical protein
MKQKDGQPSRSTGEQLSGDERGSEIPNSTELVLRDLERKRAEIDAAIASILTSHPDLKPGRKLS